jgi:hypothetical protein
MFNQPMEAVILAKPADLNGFADEVAGQVE